MAGGCSEAARWSVSRLVVASATPVLLSASASAAASERLCRCSCRSAPAWESSSALDHCCYRRRPASNPRRAPGTPFSSSVHIDTDNPGEVGCWNQPSTSNTALIVRLAARKTSRHHHPAFEKNLRRPLATRPGRTRAPAGWRVFFRNLRHRKYEARREGRCVHRRSPRARRAGAAAREDSPEVEARRLRRNRASLTADELRFITRHSHSATGARNSEADRRPDPARAQRTLEARRRL